MKVDVESPSSVERRVKVEIPAAQVRTKVDAAYKGLSRHAKIKGFRPGKVPMPLLRRHFGPSVLSEIADQLVNDTIEDAIRESSLVPAGPVSIEMGKLSEGNDFTYDASFEVFYRPTSIVTEPLTIPASPGEPTDEQVDAAIAAEQEKHANRVPVEDRGAEPGDLVTFDSVATSNGVPFAGLSGEGIQVDLAHADLLDGIREGLLGTRPGEKRTFTVSVPGEGQENASPHTVEVNAVVSALHAVERPSIDDELAKDAGHDSLDEWKQTVRAKLASEAQAKYERDVGERLFSQLISLNPFDVPHTPAHELAEIMAREMFGMKGEISTEIIHLIEPMAVRHYQEEILVEELTKQWGIEPEQDAVRAQIRSMMGTSDDSAVDAVLRGDSQNSNYLMYSAQRTLRREAVLAKLREAATVESVDTDGGTLPSADAIQPPATAAMSTPTEASE